MQFNDLLNKANSFLNQSQKRIDDLILSKKVVTAKVASTGSDKSVLRAVPSIEYNNDPNHPLYTARFTFDIKVSVVGSGIGKLLGLYIKYNGNYAKDISFGYIGVNDVFITELSEGETMYISDRPDIVSDYPYSATWNNSAVRKSCKEIENLIKTMRQDVSLGTVSVIPVFQQIEKSPDASFFKIEIGPIVSVYGCEDYNKSILNKK